MILTFQLFLLTNSPYEFTNAGMSYILGKDWTDSFDFVIASADKPTWFTSVRFVFCCLKLFYWVYACFDTSRPFRRLDISTGAVVWEPVNELVQGHIYVEGSMAVCILFSHPDKSG